MAASLCGAPLAAKASDPLGSEALLSPVGPCSDRVPARPLALTEVIDLALCRNPQTAAAWANARVEAARWGVAQGAEWPQLNATLSASRNWPDPGQTLASGPYTQVAAGLNASYLLYDFGAREATISNARELVVAAGATRDSVVQSVTLAAIQAFYQSQATAAALAAAKEAERAAEESLKAAEARYGVGSATPADRLQARTAYSQALLNRIRAEGDERNAVGALANVIGLDADQRVEPLPASEVEVPDSFERNVSALIEEARRRRPDLAAAEHQVSAAEANIRAAEAGGRPTLSLAASTTYAERIGATSAQGSSIGVTLSVPLFSGYQPLYRQRLAEAQREGAAAQRDRLRLQVALDVWNASQNLLTATQAVRTTADLLASAEQAERVSLGRYKAGVGTILDLLNAQTALAGARQQRVQALYSWNTARASLAFAMGTLDADALDAAATARPESTQ